MELGQAWKTDFLVISSNPKSLTPVTLAQVERPNECCFGLPALAETVFTSEYNNDEHSMISFLNNEFTNGQMYLQRFDAGVWSNVVGLTDDTYGTNFAYGFFETMYEEKAIGYLLDWAKVLTLQGEGRYRLRMFGILIDATFVNQYSLDFCLQEYKPHLADYSVRIDWYLNGNIGSLLSDERKEDYGTLDWFNQIRLPDSIFGNDKSAFERNFTRYDTGKKIWTQDNQVESYLLRISPVPNEIHRTLKINMLQADDIVITDYNSTNPTKHSKKSVIPTSDWEPNWVDGVEKASVEVEFQQAFENLQHKRC